MLNIALLSIVIKDTRLAKCSIVTLSIKALRIMALSILTFRIMALSIMTLR